MMQLHAISTSKAVANGLAAIATAAVLCACETFLSPLPPGTPPPGVIVSEIKDGDSLPGPDKAVNTMATNLTIELVRFAKPLVRLESANPDAGLGEKLMKSLVASKSLVDVTKGSASSARYILESRLDGSKWTVKLLSADPARMPQCGTSIELDPGSLQVAK